MKLPDFETFEPFLDLKKRMDARAPAQFTAEFSARQLLGDNFAKAEKVAMPELGDFLIERERLPVKAIKPPSPPPFPNSELIVKNHTETESITEQVSEVKAPEIKVAERAEIKKARSQPRAKLRPARKISVARSSQWSLSIAAGGFIALSLLVWMLINNLTQLPKPKDNLDPVIAAPAPAIELQRPSQTIEPEAIVSNPPAPPVIEKIEPNTIQPEPQQEALSPPPPEPAQPMQSEPKPDATQASETIPETNPQQVSPQPIEEDPSIAAPRPSMVDEADPSGLPPAGGIGGIGAGNGSVGEQAIGAIGGVGQVGLLGQPGQTIEALPPTNPKLRFRRVYVRHYVPAPPPQVEDIPAEKLPWQQP